MLKIGLIGAGHISANQLNAFKNIQNCEVVAIADINIENAKLRAKEYGIESVYSDYNEILKDDSIDAVSIVTPTFTHKQIVVDALRSGKHVLCEKPPVLNAKEAEECKKAAEECGKLLMFAFVCRFHNSTQYLKKYIQHGKMGEIVCGDCYRVSRCSGGNGWFVNREKGGGTLIDECIHEIDLLMYLMGYPDVKYVAANESYVNADLPIKFGSKGWESFDKNSYSNSVESYIEGFVMLDNAASIRFKAGKVLNAVKPGRSFEITGANAGARVEGNKLEMVEVSDDCFVEACPDMAKNNAFEDEIAHFVDCILNGTECMIKPSEAVTLMKIIDSLYKSAETKMPVMFEN